MGETGPITASSSGDGCNGFCGGLMDVNPPWVQGGATRTAIFAQGKDVDCLFPKRGGVRGCGAPIPHANPHYREAGGERRELPYLGAVPRLELEEGGQAPAMRRDGRERSSYMLTGIMLLSTQDQP
jgi:hypothetical protein